MRCSVARAIVLSWLPACVPAVGLDEARPAGRAGDVEAPAPVAPAAPVDAGRGPLELALDDAPLRPVDEVLARAAGREPAHVERAAWSADGRSFVHCRRLPGLDCTECRTIGRDGTSASLEAGGGCGEGAVPPATLDARLPALAPATTHWRDGADVVLVLETREHEESNTGDPRPMLKLGARPRDGGPPAWLVHVDPCQGCGTDQVCAAAAHVDALALSPDGDRLAVLIHQRSTQGDESTRVELLDTARVAAAARAPSRRATP